MLLFYMTILDSEEDETEFEKLYSSYKKQMFFHANSILKDDYLAEDAVHDAFVGIAKNFTTIKRLKPEQVKAYVITSARHSALMYLRKDSGNIINIDDLKGAYDENSENDFGKVETDNYILSLIKHISPKYTETMYLYFVLGMNEMEIASTLDLSYETVRKRISRGKKTFIKLIEKEKQKNEKAI